MRRRGAVAGRALLCLAFLAPSAGADPYAERRAGMVKEVRAMAEATALETGRERLDPKVLEVMGRVPRHEFVPPSQVERAYENRPLPIGHGQTISQPYIVALMTDLLGVGPGASVLEVGTGSGYQAAVLADLGARVYTVEIIEPLARSAADRLQRLGYHEVVTAVGDGYHGREQDAPFDGILVTAAAGHVPPPLVRQLKPGGKMVVPVGDRFLTQHLLLVQKDEAGRVSSRQILPVAFVPLTGEH